MSTDKSCEEARQNWRARDELRVDNGLAVWGGAEIPLYSFITSVGLLLGQKSCGGEEGNVSLTTESCFIGIAACWLPAFCTNFSWAAYGLPGTGFSLQSVPSQIQSLPCPPPHTSRPFSLISQMLHTGPVSQELKPHIALGTLQEASPSAWTGQKHNRALTGLQFCIAKEI